MILNHISILNYKNIVQTDLAFSPKLNCFFGKNGMGKTNLLDAIYFLSFCKSSSNPIDSQNMLHTADFFMIQGEYATDDGQPEEIFCGMKRKQKKQFKRNKKEYQRLSDHIGLIPLVMVSPDDSILINGLSEERRKFMDVVISQYDKVYLDALIRYNKALSQRNTLLKKEETATDEMLAIWEEMIVNPDTLEPVPDGEIGELVLTTLCREAMPLLRYRTRDLTRVLGRSCPCGRNHIRLDRMRGRSDDMIVLRGVNIFPIQIEKILMKFPEVGTNYLITLTTEDNNDQMTVEVEVNEGTDDFAKLQALSAELRHQIGDEILLKPRIRLVSKGTLPVSEGKAVRVVDKRKVYQ